MKAQFQQSLCATCRLCFTDENGKPYCDARRWWKNMTLYYITNGRKQCKSYIPKEQQ